MFINRKDHKPTTIVVINKRILSDFDKMSDQSLQVPPEILPNFRKR